MLKIRLQRVGRKNDPSFRVVVTDERRGPKSGAFLEILGSYDARKGEPQLKADRIKHWISNGARPSDTVHNLLVGAKIIDGKKRDVTPPVKKKDEEGGVDGGSTTTQSDTNQQPVVEKDSKGESTSVESKEEVIDKPEAKTAEDGSPDTSNEVLRETKTEESSEEKPEKESKLDEENKEDSSKVEESKLEDNASKSEDKKKEA